MRKVVEHGLLWQQDHFPRYTKCPNCECIFTFEREDVKDEEDAIFYPTYHYVKCPECYCICRDNASEWRFFGEGQFNEV